MENTQLSQPSGYDIKNTIFSEIIPGSIPNSQIHYKRIMITTKNPNGTTGELILPTPRVFSFGVSENKDMVTGKVNGYVLPLCLWSRDGPTKDEKAFSTTFDKIIEKCKDHIIDIKDELEQYDLERRDLKKLNPLYWKKDKGKVVDGTGPTLYAKLIVSKKRDKIMSMFFDREGEELNPLDLKGKYCYVNGAIKIESIFIGNKISLQVKLYEAEVKLAQVGMRRLLTRKKPIRILTESKQLSSMSESSDNSENIDDSEGSLNDDSDSSGSDEEEVKPKVRRTRRVRNNK